MGVAVSGGADSMALAILAHGWAHARGGTVLALIVDHGLRPASATEAALAEARLAQRGIPARILRLASLMPGPGLAERARAARYAALTEGCAEAGIVHLLLGHHAADQAETVAMRLLAGSGPAGLAGMAALIETADLRLVRPLLTIAPGALRDLLAEIDTEWTEDPSNRDPTAQRARLRALRRDRSGTGPVTRAMVESAAARGVDRATRERDAARWLAREVRLHQEGYAILPSGPADPDGLASLLRMLGGGFYPLDARVVATLAVSPGPATLGGVRIMPAGRHGPPGSWLALREAAAVQASVAAVSGATWDGRFRLRRGLADRKERAGTTLGALGADARDLPRAARAGLPASLLPTLPAIRREGRLLAIPHLAYPTAVDAADFPVAFAPHSPAAPAPFAGCGGLDGMAV